MTPEYVDEIIGLIDVAEWVGEDDFGYSIAALSVKEIDPELWAQLDPAPEHTHLLATITSLGNRAVIPVSKEEADETIRASEISYEVWLEDLYA